MDIWSTREKSIGWLNHELKQEADVIIRGFEYLKTCIQAFEQFGASEGETLTGRFCRVCSVTLAKASHLILGCYSLTLDALAQESGALLRPLIETYELLVYYRLDKSRVDQAIDKKLPPAGKIGQKIAGDFKDLRQHLSANASHFGYGIESVQHLFDTQADLKTQPTHSINVFRVNMHMINAFQTFVIFEAVNCLSAAGFDANGLADEVEIWRDLSVSVFSIPTVKP